MQFFGSKQDLTYFALRHVINLDIDKIVIKSAGEYLFNGYIEDVVNLLALGDFSSGFDKEGIANATEMELAGIMEDSYNVVIEDMVNSILLNEV